MAFLKTERKRKERREGKSFQKCRLGDVRLLGKHKTSILGNSKHFNPRERKQIIFRGSIQGILCKNVELLGRFCNSSGPFGVIAGS